MGRQRLLQPSGRTIECTGGFIDAKRADAGVVTVNKEHRARVVLRQLAQLPNPLLV